MKKHLMKFSFLFILLTTSLPISGQIIDDPVNFQLSEDHELRAVARGSLTWNDGEQEQVTVNLTMSDFRVNNSEIQIFRIVLSIRESGTGSPDPSTFSNTSQVTLTTTSRSVVYAPVFNVPDSFDRFYINITMLVAPSGGGVDDTPQTHSFRFPQDSTIIVQRDNIVPVINLYGFPSGEFFRFWLPIYATFLVMLLTPATIVGVSKIKELRSQSGSNQSETGLEEGDQGNDNSEQDVKEEMNDE